jgi:hypothetical protein
VNVVGSFSIPFTDPPLREAHEVVGSHIGVGRWKRGEIVYGKKRRLIS